MQFSPSFSLPKIVSLDQVISRKSWLKKIRDIGPKIKEKIREKPFLQFGLKTPWAPCSQNYSEMVFFNIFQKEKPFKMCVRSRLPHWHISKNLRKENLYQTKTPVESTGHLVKTQLTAANTLPTWSLGCLGFLESSFFEDLFLNKINQAFCKVFQTTFRSLFEQHTQSYITFVFVIIKTLFS